jgi:hypothetical protein
MAGLGLDSTGNIKMKVLEESLLHLQRIHGLVEQYALAVKAVRPSSVFVQNLRRQLPTLAANLKGQFGMISDLVTAMNLASSRGGSEAVKVRALREGVAQVRQAIEIGIVQTKDKHSKEKAPAAEKPPLPTP